MIVLNDTLGAVGGSHTLFLRMCGWYRSNGYAVSFFCNNRDNEEIASQLEKIGVRIYVINTSNTKETYKLLKQIDDGDVKVINFWGNMYLNIELVKRRYHINVENFIYLIHPKCLIKGDSYNSNSKFCGIIKNGYKDIISKMCENNAIVSMDEINICETENYYKIKLTPIPPIARLPMNIDSINRDEAIRIGYDSKVIMTSCRADFPYKGYVIGLVDEFISLKKDYSDLKLKIICDGNDIDILRKKIEEIPNSLKKDVQLLGWVNYEELKNMMNECMIYIGMGSSVLDSSLRYKPSAVIKFYTMDCIGRYYTAENPIDLAAGSDIEESALSMLKKVLAMSFNEYKDFSERSFVAISELYEISNVMKKFVNFHNKSQKSVLSLKDELLVVANNIMNNIRFGNQKEKSSVTHLSKTA